MHHRKNVRHLMNGKSSRHLLTALFHLMALILVSIPPSASGQEPVVSCDTLILKNGRHIEAHVDSITDVGIFYHLCPDSVVRPRVLPVGTVSGIRSSGGNTGPDDRGLEEARSLAAAQPSVWLFRNLRTQETKKLRTGRQVKLRTGWGGRGGNMVRGQFLGLTDSTVLVRHSRKGIIQVRQDQVLRMSFPRLGGKAAGILGGVLAGFGAALLVMMLLVLIVAGLLTLLLAGSVDTSGANRDAKKFKGTSLIFLLLAIPLIFLAIPSSIDKPFSADWKVTKMEEPSGPGPESQLPMP